MCYDIILLLYFPISLHSMAKESNTFLCRYVGTSASVWYVYLCWCVGTYRVCKAKSITAQFIGSCGPSDSVPFMCLLHVSLHCFAYRLISFDPYSELCVSFMKNFTLFIMLGIRYILFSLFYCIWYHVVNLFSVLCQLSYMFNLFLYELYSSWNILYESLVFSHLLLV